MLQISQNLNNFQKRSIYSNRALNEPIHCSGSNYHEQYLQNPIINSETSNNKIKFKNVSSENIKSYYSLSFRGYTGAEISTDSDIGLLLHETGFFGELETDEIVQKYILDSFSKDPEINIVSGACSVGNEARSYAMMLDSLGNKLHISGFDISNDIINQAQSDTARILLVQYAEYKQIEDEYFLSDKYNWDLTPYQQRCKEKFKQYYDYISDLYITRTYPNAQNEYNDLLEIIEDEQTYNKLRKQFYKTAQKTKKNIFHINGKQIFLDPTECGVNFVRSVETALNTLKMMIETAELCQNVKAKKGSFLNCEFKQGNILNLENLYRQNSINVLLYRNAIYHNLCSSILRDMREDASVVMNNISRQMNKVVKMQGLVVFGENEANRGIDVSVIEKAMKNNGFKMFNQKKNIWIKVREIVRPF